jgi:pilus assembly protein Flp/PilA
MEMIKRFFKDEEGATAVEYGILVALIGAVMIATVTLLGTAISSIFAMRTSSGVRSTMV